MGIYQLYFLKMHSKLLFLSRNAGTKDPAFLSRVLADTLAAAKEAMRGRNFRSRRKITPRNPAAERQRPQGAAQIESRNKKLHALFCTARAVSFLQGLTMWGQGACPLHSLGVLKGVFSTVENTPFVRCRALRGRYSSSGSSHGVIVATRRWMGVPSSWNFAS